MPRKINKKLIEDRLISAGYGSLYLGEDSKCKSSQSIFQCCCGTVFRACRTKTSLRGGLCRSCSSRKPVSYFNDKIADRNYKLIKFTDKYLGKNGNDRCGLFRCDVGHEWEGSIRSGVSSSNKGCPICSGKFTRTASQVHERLIELNLRINEPYRKSSDTYDVECLVCGVVTKKTLTRILKVDKVKSACANCSKRAKIPISKVEEYINANLEGHTLLSKDYIEGDKVHIKCNNGHDWIITRTNLMIAHKRCGKCFRGGYDSSVKGYFYYLRVQPEDSTTPLYKIGITNRSVEERFYKSDLEKITVLRVLEFDNGQSAKDLESYYLKLFKDFRYQGEPILTSGNTELMTHDVLGLDT